MSDPSALRSEDFATPDGIEVLDQLCLTLLECLLIANDVQRDVGLNLDELISGLSAIQNTARSAFRAASLLNQRAELEVAWSDYFSRPKAIFARHHAAVRSGARMVRPREPAASLFDAELDDAMPIDDGPQVGTPRPACTSATKAKRACSNTAIYLGSGVFAQHCYSHLTAVERRRFDKHRDEIAALEDRLLEEGAQHIARAAELVRLEWQRKRQTDGTWIDTQAAWQRSGEFQ
ncbi:hypothetical protein [Mycolicibacterium lacusdiani]|uniref:hypothetical protein n=1 Tax=Mycolicibacterium lacusdiani TaxID=2895283 RepID=UPI001F46DBFB|nr:hypothetical protein [Mycolicibacterium lacusdiani]